MFGNNVYLQSGQLPSTASTSVKEMLHNRLLSSPKPVVKSESTQDTDGLVDQRRPRRGRGRPRKVLAAPRSCTGGEVVDDQKLELPQRTGSAINQRPSRQSKILSAILTGTRGNKIDGDVDHEDVQLVAPSEVTEPVKPNDIWERKSLRNSGD